MVDHEVSGSWLIHAYDANKLEPGGGGLTPRTLFFTITTARATPFNTIHLRKQVRPGRPMISKEINKAGMRGKSIMRPGATDQVTISRFHVKAYRFIYIVKTSRKYARAP